jgi:hypothetical protein
MPAIMSLEERRPRGTVLGERADRRRVGEACHFFDATRATAGSTRGISYGLGITSGPLPHPAQDQVQIARQDH